MLAPRILPLVALVTLAAPASAEEVVSVPRFDQVELNGGGEVVLTHGPVQKVIILEGSTQFTRIRVSDRHPNRLTIDACNRHCPNRYDLKIEIQTPDLDALSVNGGGKIAASTGFPRQKDIAVSVNGGGLIDLRSLPISEVAAAVNGGGRLLVRAEDSLAASVNGGGSISYWGKPRLATSIDGGGSVTPGR